MTNFVLEIPEIAVSREQVGNSSHLVFVAETKLVTVTQQ